MLSKQKSNTVASEIQLYDGIYATDSGFWSSAGWQQVEAMERNNRHGNETPSTLDERDERLL